MFCASAGLFWHHEVALQWLHAGYDFLNGIYDSTVPLPVRLAVWDYAHQAIALIFDPVMYLLLAGVLVLERLIPAKRGQPLLSPGLAQDYGWFLAESLIFLQLMAALWGLQMVVYDRYLSFLTLPVASWPFLARALCTILLGDMLRWLHHLIRHKIGVFWEFHVIHHSQKQMNFFADFRIHIVELIVAQSIIFIPMAMFSFHFPQNVYLLFLFTWYTRIYHSNLRTNFGFLKHILVTPQSHRIHHSIEPRHWDKNFGVVFTIWDRIFGTLYKNYDEYPETGVADEFFPWERADVPKVCCVRSGNKRYIPFTAWRDGEWHKGVRSSQATAKVRPGSAGSL